MTRVDAFSFGEWTCTYSRKGHLFTHPNKPSILVRRGAYPGQLVVQRNWFRRMLHIPPAYYGSITGGDAGGQGIVLHPVWDEGTQAAMDGTIRRHHIGLFLDGGTPTLGDGKRHPLTATMQPDGYERIDGPHLVRAYSHAVAQFKHDHDPVAFMWLVLCAYDAIRRFPLVPFSDGEGPEYSLATMHTNVMASPHLAKLGVVRELAWCLRIVVEALRAMVAESNMAHAAMEGMFRTWVVQFVEMIYLGQALNGSYADNYYGEGASEQDQPWLVLQPGFRLLLTNEGEATSWQRCFLNRALAEAAKVCPRTLPQVRECLQRDRLLYTTCSRVPDRYHAEREGFPYWLIVSRDGHLLPAITEGVGLADTTYEADTLEAYREVGA